MARATAPSVARSSAASEAGTAVPCGSATASSGVASCASGALITLLCSSDMLDYALGKGGGRDLGGVGQQAREIVGHVARSPHALQPPNDCRRDLGPAEFFEHHRARQ